MKSHYIISFESIKIDFQKLIKWNYKNQTFYLYYFGANKTFTGNQVHVIHTHSVFVLSKKKFPSLLANIKNSSKEATITVGKSKEQKTVLLSEHLLENKVIEKNVAPTTWTRDEFGAHVCKEIVALKTLEEIEINLEEEKKFMELKWLTLDWDKYKKYEERRNLRKIVKKKNSL